LTRIHLQDPPVWVMIAFVGICDDCVMLNELSTQMADAVDAVTSSVVQVQGRRRPASGLVHSDGIVLAMMRAIGRDDGLHIRRPDGTVLDAELVAWDPTTTLAVLRVKDLGLSPPRLSSAPPRVGNLVMAVARSWSNAVTASAGIISVIGGPLRTGRRRAIDQVIRTTAPMHDGFSGGALIATSGDLLGVATATTIRGTTVVIPAQIAWAAAQRVIERGQTRRGYLGVIGQPVQLSESQAASCGRQTALLVVGVAPASAAASAGVLVGDVVLALDDTSTDSPEDLLDLLAVQGVGRQAKLKVLRGNTAVELPVTIGERPAR
jgi:S1-C subfamily serine protease